jgi:hypothetical protein
MFAFSMLGAAPAGGQETDAARDEARVHFETGLTLMEAEDWDAALGEFERSLDLHPTRAALFNLAMCQKALHRYLEAIATFERWRGTYGGDAPEGEVEAVERALGQLEALTARVVFEVNVPGATVLLDGREVGVSPLDGAVALEVGPHVAEARVAGRAPVRVEFRVASRDHRTVALTFGAAGESAPPVDPPDVGGPPVEPTRGGPDGGAGTPGTMPADEGLASGWFWGTAAAAVALAIGGGVTGGLVLDRADAFDEAATACEGGDAGACDRGRAILDEHDDYKLATNILVPAAAAFAATALALAFFTDWGGEGEASEPPPVSGTPVLTGDGVGFELSLRF